MLFNLILVMCIFLGIILTLGSKKYKEHSQKAGEEDLKAWYNNKYRNEWYNKNRNNKKY